MPEASFDSILAFTEETFGLAPLSSRDATAYDYSQSFDYSEKPLSSVRMVRIRLTRSEQEWRAAHPARFDPNDPT